MLKLTADYITQPVTMKLHLYALCLELREVTRQFEELKSNYRDWMLKPENTEMDALGDDQEWSKEDFLQLPKGLIYRNIEAEQITLIRESLDKLPQLIIDASPCDTFEVNLVPMKEILCDEIQGEHLAHTIEGLLETLRDTLDDLRQLLQDNTFTDEEAELYWNRVVTHYQLNYSRQAKTLFDQWMLNNSIADDEEQLERHYKGKIRIEIEQLFQSGFLKPRLKDQYEVDLEVLKKELLEWRIEQMTGIEQPKMHFSAFRDFFRPIPNGFEPKKKSLGRYMLAHRREVNEEMRKACCHFCRTLELLMKLRQPKMEGQERVRKVEENSKMAADKPKKRVKQGPPITQIFNSDEKRQAVAQWIHETYTAYYDNKRSALVIENSSYNLTDFLLAIYYVLVEQGHTISVINNPINKQYYKFLTEDCRLKGCLKSDKTFQNHLSKLIATGKDFYLLTEDIVDECTKYRGFTLKEYERMKNMTATVSRLLSANN